MRPKDVIAALKNGQIGKPGRLTLANPITNIPVSDSDYQAARVIEFILDEIMPEKATLQDILVVLAETQWWLVFFASFQDNRALEPVAGLTPYAPDKCGLALAQAETVKEVISPVESDPL
jgi:hypothetical protein